MTLAAILVVLALVVAACAVVLARTRRATMPLLVRIDDADARGGRLRETLLETRVAASLAHSSAERALWAVTRFDARIERVEAALRGHRAKLDEATLLAAGMSDRLGRLRSVAALVFGR